MTCFIKSVGGRDGCPECKAADEHERLGERFQVEYPDEYQAIVLSDIPCERILAEIDLRLVKHYGWDPWTC